MVHTGLQSSTNPYCLNYCQHHNTHNIDCYHLQHCGHQHYHHILLRLPSMIRVPISPTPCLSNIVPFSISDGWGCDRRLFCIKVLLVSQLFVAVRVCFLTIQPVASWLLAKPFELINLNWTSGLWENLGMPFTVTAGFTTHWVLMLYSATTGGELSQVLSEKLGVFAGGPGFCWLLWFYNR